MILPWKESRHAPPSRRLPIFSAGFQPLCGDDAEWLPKLLEAVYEATLGVPELTWRVEAAGG